MLMGSVPGGSHSQLLSLCLRQTPAPISPFCLSHNFAAGVVRQLLQPWETGLTQTRFSEARLLLGQSPVTAATVGGPRRESALELALADLVFPPMAPGMGQLPGPLS